jgi:hypothetical protein
MHPLGCFRETARRAEKEERTMGLMDRAKNMAGQAAAKARESAEDVKARHDLGNAYDELGKLTFDLVESGEIANDKLTPVVERIRSLKAELAS